VAACFLCSGVCGRSVCAGGGRGAGPVAEVSRGCRVPSAEAEQAVDYPYVYETWIGCGGTGFARSTDGGRSFGHPLRIPGSAGHGYWRIGCDYLPTSGWDPAVAVAPDGTVYLPGWPRSLRSALGRHNRAAISRTLLGRFCRKV
jgi:hypothetical protein